MKVEMMKYKFFFLLFVLFSVGAFGQDKMHMTLDAYFAQDTIKLQAGKSFSNTIVLKNTSADPIKIDSIKADKNYPGMLFSPAYKGFVQNSENTELKIRMIASKELLMSSFSEIAFWVYSKIGGQAQKQMISFKIQREKMDFVAVAAVGDLFYNPTAQENMLRFFVENQSYESRVVRVKLKLVPDDFISVFPDEQIVQLNSKEKQILTVQLKKRQNINYYPDYNLSVEVLDNDLNTTVSTVILPIRSLSSYRMMNYDANIQQYKNYVEASYNNSDNLNNFYKFRTNYETKVGSKATVGINSTVDYYHESKNVNIYDTRLDLNFSKFSAGLGNVYGQDYDFNISGRGVKLGARLSPKSTVEVLGLDNNYMLYTDFSNGFSAGKTAAMQLRHLWKKNRSAQLNYVFNQNNFSKVDTQLFNIKTPIYSDSIQMLSLESGLSFENLSTDNHQLDKMGWASGLQYQYNKNRWAVQSNNFYSSPYYSGIRRGALYLDESLQYRASEKDMVYLRYNQSLNQSGYLNDAEPLGFTENSKFNNFLVEAGWAKNGVLRWSISPNYIYQYIHTPYNILEYTAYRMRLNVGKSFHQHNVNFSWDGGWSQFNQNQKSIFAQRLVLNYAYKFLNVSTMADINPTNAYDLNWYQGGTYVNYSASLGTRLVALRKKMIGYVNLGYSFLNTQKTDSFYLNSNVDYKLSPMWSLTGMAYYNFYHNSGVMGNPGFQNSNLQFKIGLRMSLGNSAQGNKLSLKVFEDDNFNQKFDAGEKVIPNAIVKLNQQIIAITNEKGLVKYANMKEGEYDLSISKNNQPIPLLGLGKIKLSNNTKLEIPVVKTIHLLGTLKELKDKYDVQQADLMGINIYAQNLETGKITISITELDGSFNFQLIEGKYKFYIQNDRYEILNNNQELTLKNNSEPEKLIFNFKNKELKIRKKQF